MLSYKLGLGQDDFPLDIGEIDQWCGVKSLRKKWKNDDHLKIFQRNEEWNWSTTSTLFISLKNLNAVEMLFWLHIIWVTNCIPAIHILWVIGCASTWAISLQICNSCYRKYKKEDCQ